MKKVMMFAVLSGMSLTMAIPASATGDEKVSAEIGADLVSSYIWRGTDCGGFSVQPAATFTWKRSGISLGVWASAELFEQTNFANMSEFDLALSWSASDALSIGVTDYYFCDGKYLSHWDFSGRSLHNLELNLSYDFGPVALAWNTCLTGNDYKGNGKRAYSTYCEITAPFKLGNVDFTGAVGILPWEDSFTTGGQDAGVCNLSLTAEKEVCKLPFSGSIIYNPQSETTFFVVGLSF